MILLVAFYGDKNINPYLKCHYLMAIFPKFLTLLLLVLSN